MNNREYYKFLETKRKKANANGFKIKNDSILNKNLFNFQRYITKRALEMGNFAVFADTGLGKTIIQLSWADYILQQIDKPILIFSPLAVSGQTIEEGRKFGIEVNRLFLNKKIKNKIYITNYEQLKNVDSSFFEVIILDESSILKNYTGVYKNLLIDIFKHTKYKLTCTASPSPNDINEIGNHSEFLN